MDLGTSSATGQLACTSTILRALSLLPIISKSSIYWVLERFLTEEISHFEYLHYERGQDRALMQREAHTLMSFPPELQKKVTLLKHFKGYMQENLNKVRLVDGICRFYVCLRLNFFRPRLPRRLTIALTRPKAFPFLQSIFAQNMAWCFA